MRQFDRVAFEDGTGLVSIDHDSPDRVAARAEPLHEDDDDDFDECLAPDDDGEFVDLAGIKDIPRDAIQRLVLFLIPPQSKPRKRWRIAQLRLAIIAQIVDSDGIGKLSFEDLGKQLGCTRALLSYHSLKLIDSLGIEKLPNSKPRRTREIYRQSAIESHRRQGHRMTQDEPQTVSATK